MIMEGGLSSTVKVMENLDILAVAFENVIDACAKLESLTMGLSSYPAISCALEAIEEDVNNIEQWVRGYLHDI